MERFDDVLENRGGSYILPFFWLHGEAHEILREEIDRIEACGIREFCVESRPHPDFLGEQWWSDLDMIMQEARMRGMRVWLLDDDKFPTGHAGGGYGKEPEKAKLYVAERHMDLCGPLVEGAVLVENFLGTDGELLGIYACPKSNGKHPDIAIAEAIDLTDKLHGGIVYLDIPDGYYRLFVLFTTRKGGGRDNYMNLIDKESVRVLLDQVYEPHYERYKEDFGTTLAGFFSDEPELGNVPGYGFEEKLGRKNVRLPWSRQLEEMLQERWGEGFPAGLIALWYQAGEKTAALRRDYMDCVSILLAENFSLQIGEWCREHGVEYIGHVIEDDNAHARLGCSVAHYFRAEKGMDRAGIDVVHLQIIPGFKECDHQWIASDRDGEFFHYGLAKLGSSLARLDERKKGRALCEIFGSFGWAEGVWLMKWLTDHMLVRGINHFVPHAFSPRFPDRDCPPHFYARGNNPQYPYFRELMKYMNRMCHLVNGGNMDVDVAVLYHADAEWCGDTELFQRPLRKLMERQVDCDVIWSDLLRENGYMFREGKLCVQQQIYSCLIIPSCQYVTADTAQFIVQAKKAGFPVLFMNGFPERCLAEEIDVEEIRATTELVAEEQLEERVEQLRDRRNFTVNCLRGDRKDLRACTYRQQDGSIYLFFNEHPTRAVKIEAVFREKGTLLRYDAVSNRAAVAGSADDRLILELDAGEMAVYIRTERVDRSKLGDFTELFPKADPEEDRVADTAKTGRVLEGPWEIALREEGIAEVFTTVCSGVPGSSLRSINGPNAYPRFSGTIRYRTEFEMKEDTITDRNWILALPGLHDGARVRINGREAGVLLGAPYRMFVGAYLRKGQNLLEIETVNTLTWRVHDGQSTHMQMYPTGMVKAPVLYGV